MTYTLIGLLYVFGFFFTMVAVIVQNPDFDPDQTDKALAVFMGCVAWPIVISLEVLRLSFILPLKGITWCVRKLT